VAKQKEMEKKAEEERRKKKSGTVDTGV